MSRDPGLDTLLELHGTEYTEDNGYWFKIEARRVEPSETVPHGIRYSLTLHDNHNQRILGFDNAHAVKSRRAGGYSGQIIEYDHKHMSMKDKGTPYVFTDAQHLLEDFFSEVNRIMKEVSK